MAHTNFKKGDRVTFFSDWDRMGGCTYQHFVVESIGKVRMYARKLTGDMSKRAFSPFSYGNFYLTEGLDYEALALAFGEQFKSREINHLERCLKNESSESYKRGIQERLEETRRGVVQAIAR